jgi:hypothetical protein
MTFLDLLALILASGAVVDCWFNGDLFAEWHAFLEAKQDADNTEEVTAVEDDSDPANEADSWATATPVPWTKRLADKILPRWAVALLLCRYCLSYHVPFWLALVFYVPALFVVAPWSLLLKLPVYGLAATRAANILNGLLPGHLQYKRVEDNDE